MESNSDSPCICQRLINFILRRSSALPGPTEVPIEEASSTNPINRLNCFVESEIMVEFRHTDGYRNKRGFPILDPKKDGLIVNSPKQTVTIKGSEKKKKKAGSDHQATMVNNHIHDETKPMHRQYWPFLRVASNIDKKSDEYIESRKKAMGRNYSLDHEKS